MSKRNVAIILLFAGVSVIIFLAAMILSEQEADKEVVACERKVNTVFDENKKTLWSDSKYFIQYNTKDFQLGLYSWAINSEKFLPNNISHIKLACEKPNYNCLSQKENINVKFFSPPVGLLQANNEKLFPFTWNSQKELRMGAPLALCRKELSQIKNIKVFSFGNHLFVYDYQRNILGFYDANKFSGATMSSGIVDAEKIYTIVDQGSLLVSSCEHELANQVDVYNIESSKNQLFVFKTNKPGWIYSYGQDFIPRIKTKSSVFLTMKDEKNEAFLYTDLKNIFVTNVVDQSEVLLDKVSSSFFENLARENTVQIKALSSMDSILSYTTGGFLSKDKIEMFDLKNSAIRKIPLYRNFFKKKFIQLDLNFYSPKQGYVFLQREGSSGFFSSFECK